MIYSIEQIKSFISTTLPDELLQEIMAAEEFALNKLTNFAFVVRGSGCYSAAISFTAPNTISIPAVWNSTKNILILQTTLNDNIYSVASRLGGTFTVNEVVEDEKLLEGGQAFQIAYPPSIKMLFVDMVKEKVKEVDGTTNLGVKSETQGSHSITYDTAEKSLGYSVGVSNRIKALKKGKL